MRSWCKVSKHDWPYMRQTSLTEAYKNLFPNKTVSIPAMNMLRSSLSIYIYFVYNEFYFLIASFVNSSVEVTFQIAFILQQHFYQYGPRKTTKNIYRISSLLPKIKTTDILNTQQEYYQLHLHIWKLHVWHSLTLLQQIYSDILHSGCWTILNGGRSGYYSPYLVTHHK
jgi:hypothetical protein